jgi:D-serine deaminase-like pyridoxal phosphate-dependent protein
MPEPVGPDLPDGLLTPATIVFADRMERNLSAMAAFSSDAHIALRPHAKTHKCREIARRQMALGARGLSVATVGEAEILAQPGSALPDVPGGSPDVTDIFVAYPLWADEDLIGRLNRLVDRARITVGADSAEAVSRLAPISRHLRMMIEIDCGLGRSGVGPEDVTKIARAADQIGLELSGVFTFPGHSYSPGAGERAALDEAAALSRAKEVLDASGFECTERSGGSTPSARHVREASLTEMRPGVYVFNDAQQVELGVAGMEDVALMVAATVVSRPAPGRVVLDSGSKVLGADRPSWATGHGRLADWPDARMVGLWEHHAVVELEGAGPALGDVVAVVPNHVCTAVNLVPELVVVDGGRVVDIWPVAARVANR